MPIRLVVLELRGEVDQTDDREENQRIEYHRNKAMVLDQRKELKELEEAMGEKEMAQDRREKLKELEELDEAMREKEMAEVGEEMVESEIVLFEKRAKARRPEIEEESTLRGTMEGPPM